MRKYMWLLCIWVLFESGATLHYEDAYEFEIHDGVRMNMFDPTLVSAIQKDKWLVLLNAKSNSIKSLDNWRVEDFGICKKHKKKRN
jgi:hypothetical protein